jgi:hypothetical protein
MDRKFKIITTIIVFLFFSSVVYGIFNKVKRTREKIDINTPLSISPEGEISSPTPNLSPPVSPTAINTATPEFTGKVITVRPDQAPTIQEALNTAAPGDIIELQSGTYFQDVITVRNGLPSKPITIKGPKEAIVKGADEGRIIEINHSYITLDGFTVDGLAGSSSELSGFRDKLIYMIGKTPGQGPSYNRISNMDIKNAGGECIRLRYFARGNEITGNRITNCGVHDYRFNDGGKNGEGIYIGTAPEQTDDKKNPTSETDQSNGNWVHNNYFDTQGNECTDIKEGSTGNIVEYNTCTGQKDENSGGFDSRGNENVFRFNEIFDNLGAGVRLGGDNEIDGVNNHVYQNVIRNNAEGAIKFQRKPQGKICGNDMNDNGDEPFTGSYGEDFDPGASC